MSDNDNDTPTPPVERKTANKLNPFISEHDVLGTCQLVSTALKGLSHVVCMCENQQALLPTEESLSLLQDQLDLLAAALDFEGPPWTPEAKEASNG